MSKAITLCLIIVGLINFLPVLGVISAERISQAYSVTLGDNNLIILLRHRAILFGIVGGFVLYSVFVPAYQTPAMVMAGVSMLAYIVLMLQVGAYNQALYKIMLVDWLGLLFLVIAIVLKVFFQAR